MDNDRSLQIGGVADQVVSDCDTLQDQKFKRSKVEVTRSSNFG